MTKYEKGYGIKVISKGMVKKAAFGEAIKAVTDITVLQEKMQKALDTGGRVYGLYYKKELKGYYIFSKEVLKKEQIEYDFEKSVFAFFGNKKDEINVYRLIESYMLPACESMREGLEKDIKEELKENMVFYEIKAIVWNEEALVLEEKKGSGFGGIGGMGIGLLFALSYGMLFDNLALGICLGMMWGVCFGTIFSSAKVRELKPAEDIKNDAETTGNDGEISGNDTETTGNDREISGNDAETTENDVEE